MKNFCIKIVCFTQREASTYQPRMDWAADFELKRFARVVKLADTLDLGSSASA